MVAYEFLTEVTADRTLLIPPNYANSLHTGAPVRVILLVEENGNANGHHVGSSEALTSLEAVVAEIKRMPRNPNNIKPASGLLGKHLLAQEQKLDPTFDINEWLQQWDQLEAEMKAASLANEERTVKEMAT